MGINIAFYTVWMVERQLGQGGRKESAARSRHAYLSRDELFEAFNGHSSAEHSSDGGETRVVPAGADGTPQKRAEGRPC